MKKRIVSLIIITAFLLVLFVPCFASAAVDNSLLVNTNFVKGWCLNPQQPLNNSFTNNWHNTIRPADGLNRIDLGDTVFRLLNGASLNAENYFYIYYYNYTAESLEIYRVVNEALESTVFAEYSYSYSFSGTDSYPVVTIIPQSNNFVIYKASLPFSVTNVSLANSWTYTVFNQLNTSTNFSLTLYANNIFDIVAVRTVTPFTAYADNFLPRTTNFYWGQIATLSLDVYDRDHYVLGNASRYYVSSYDFQGDYLPVGFDFRCNYGNDINNDFCGNFNLDVEHITSLLNKNFIYTTCDGNIVRNVSISSSHVIRCYLGFSGLGLTANSTLAPIFNGAVLTDITIYYGGDSGNYSASRVTSITDIINFSFTSIYELRDFISNTIGSFPDYVVFLVFMPLSSIAALGVFAIIKRLVF